MQPLTQPKLTFFPTPQSQDRLLTIYVFIASTTNKKGKEGLCRKPVGLKPANECNSVEQLMLFYNHMFIL